ncbi:uncharacterized protein [Pyrus communis]|uniref:uncharacterized protein n=1 Tax=Pyrus communis TaxID=23211 RepID=UPI0035C2146E
MPGDGHFFVEWKEHFVSQERGNRVVHYFLKDSSGESILAVVGTERSVRHMFYVVSEEFLQAHGNESSNSANYKWRSRREVVDWLTSMLSKQHVRGDLSESPQHDSSQALWSPELPMKGVSGHQGCLSKTLTGCNPAIVWSGVAWTCGKQLKHFPAFCRDGTTIAIKSFVFVMAKGENHYVAYMEDMYEDKRGQKKVKVRWFHRNQEVKGLTPVRNPHPKEVFITPYVQVISAECVDGPATVLTCEHYEKCVAVFPQALLAKVHLCYRQFRSNKVKPFDLSKMHGYFDQPILSCLGLEVSKKSKFISDSLIGEADELGPSDYVKQGSKRTRSGRPCQRFSTGRSRARSSTRDNQMMTYRPQNPNYGLLDKRLLSMKLVDCQPWYTPLFKVEEKIELLCQDSGIRGCWFRCTVLQLTRKQMKVQYDDLQDEEGSGNLEEWIPAFRLALPDKLGIRHLGRPMVRPAPPKEQMGLALEVGVAVDAWWSDGWWEGIIAEVGSCGDTFQVFIPGESLLLNMHKNDLRISRDWFGDEWVDVEAKPDVLSAISSTLSSCTRPFMLPVVVKDVDSDGFALSYVEVPSSTKHVEEEKLNLATSYIEVPSSTKHVEEEQQNVAISASFEAPENMDLDSDMKSPPLNDVGNEGVDVNDSYGDVQDVQGNDVDDNEGDKIAKDDKGDNGGGDGKNNGHDEGQEGMEVFETACIECVDGSDSCDVHDVQVNEVDDDKDDNNGEADKHDNDNDEGKNRGHDEGQEGMEVFETAGEGRPEAVEIMEVIS